LLLLGHGKPGLAGLLAASLGFALLTLLCCQLQPCRSRLLATLLGLLLLTSLDQSLGSESMCLSGFALLTLLCCQLQPCRSRLLTTLLGLLLLTSLDQSLGSESTCLSGGLTTSLGFALLTLLLCQLQPCRSRLLTTLLGLFRLTSSPSAELAQVAETISRAEAADSVVAHPSPL
jgi:hypothetical protein